MIFVERWQIYLPLKIVPKKEIDMAARMEYGTVNPSGVKTSGSAGWTVRSDGTGLYLLIFEPHFSSVVSVVATQIYPNDLRSTGGDTRDNAVIVGADNDEAKIKTGNNDGKAENRWFSFIALGT